MQSIKISVLAICFGLTFVHNTHAASSMSRSSSRAEVRRDRAYTDDRDDGYYRSSRRGDRLEARKRSSSRRGEDEPSTHSPVETPDVIKREATGRVDLTTTTQQLFANPTFLLGAFNKAAVWPLITAVGKSWGVPIKLTTQFYASYDAGLVPSYLVHQPVSSDRSTYELLLRSVRQAEQTTDPSVVQLLKRCSTSSPAKYNAYCAEQRSLHPELFPTDFNPIDCDKANMGVLFLLFEPLPDGSVKSRFAASQSTDSMQLYLKMISQLERSKKSIQDAIGIFNTKGKLLQDRQTKYESVKAKLAELQTQQKDLLARLIQDPNYVARHQELTQQLAQLQAELEALPALMTAAEKEVENANKMSASGTTNKNKRDAAIKAAQAKIDTLSKRKEELVDEIRKRDADLTQLSAMENNPELTVIKNKMHPLEVKLANSALKDNEEKKLAKAVKLAKDTIGTISKADQEAFAAFCASLESEPVVSKQSSRDRAADHPKSQRSAPDDLEDLQPARKKKDVRLTDEFEDPMEDDLPGATRRSRSPRIDLYDDEWERD